MAIDKKPRSFVQQMVESFSTNSVKDTTDHPPTLLDTDPAMQFCVVKKPSLYEEYGQPDEFNELWLAGYQGFSLTTIRQALVQNRKTRHDPSVPKDTSHHTKTSGPSMVTARMMLRDSENYQPVWGSVADNTKFANQPDVREVYKLIDPQHPDNELYCAYERQDLLYLQRMLDEGKYDLEDIDLIVSDDGKIKAANIVVSEKVWVEKNGKKELETRFYMIRVKEEELKNSETRLKSPLSVMRKFFDKLATKNTQDLPSLRAIKELDNEGKKRLLFASPLFSDHKEQTAKILNCEPDIANGVRVGWNVDERPNIISNANGIPIKGDMDQRHYIYSNNVPLPIAMELIALGKDENLVGNLIKRFADLIAALNESKTIDPAMKIKLITVIRAAQERLHDYSFDEEGQPRQFNSITQRNYIVNQMGNIGLLHAAVVLGQNTLILHGADESSPLLPENFAAEHIPDPSGKFTYETYGEFDYLKFLLINEDMFKDKIIEFNTCSFAKVDDLGRSDIPNKGPRVKEDVVTKDRDGNMRTYNNYADEDASIALIKILFERQLLLLKQQNPAQFEDYLTGLLANESEKLQRARDKPDPFLVRGIEIGLEIKRQIIAKVRAYPPEQIAVRLEQIRSLAKVTTTEMHIYKTEHYKEVPVPDALDHRPRSDSTDSFDGANARPRGSSAGLDQPSIHIPRFLGTPSQLTTVHAEQQSKALVRSAYTHIIQKHVIAAEQLRAEYRP